MISFCIEAKCDKYVRLYVPSHIHFKSITLPKTTDNYQFATMYILNDFISRIAYASVCMYMRFSVQLPLIQSLNNYAIKLHTSHSVGRRDILSKLDRNNFRIFFLVQTHAVKRLQFEWNGNSQIFIYFSIFEMRDLSGYELK